MTTADDSFSSQFWHPGPVRSLTRMKELAGELGPSGRSLQSAIQSWLAPAWENKAHPYLPAAQAGHLLAAYLRHTKPVRALEVSSACYPMLMEALAGNDIGALHWASLEKTHAVDLQGKVAGRRWFLQMESLDALHAERRFPVVLVAPKRGVSQAWDKRLERHGLPTLLKSAQFLEEGGTLLWATTSYAFTSLGYRPGARSNALAHSLEGAGLCVRAIVELPSIRLLANTAGHAVVVVLGRLADTATGKVFAAQIPVDRLWSLDELAPAADALWKAFRAQLPAQEGEHFAWVETSDWRRYSDIEAQAEMESLRPQGVELVSLGSLVKRWQRGSWDIEPAGEDDIFIPHDELGCAAEDIDATGVGRTTCFRATLNADRCNKHYVLRVLNSAYGRRARRHATDIDVIDSVNFQGLPIPLPDRGAQNRLGAEWLEVMRTKAALDRRLDKLVSDTGV